MLIILTLSLVTHFSYFGQPNETVFDEVHFGKFVNGYLTGEYFFDIHPPLGKLILSGAGYLSGFEPGFSFADIGDVFPDKQYMALRFLPTLAGLFLPLVIYFLALRLGLSRRGSFLAAIFIVFENALNIQSRFILLDSFLLLFGFLSIWFYLKFRSCQRYRWLLGAGIFAILAGAIKWTGLGFLAVILAFQFWELIVKRNFARLFSNFLYLFLIPSAIYVLIFALHLQLLPKSGTGDAFMSLGFQKTLLNNHYQNDDTIKPINFFEKFIELNVQMYGSNQRVTAHHPYGSKWYSWPFLIRPVYFWNDSQGPGQVERKIYLLGNPFVWWASTVAMLLMLMNFGRNLIKRIKPELGPKIILSGFFINLLPFIGIGRVMFIYHYFVSLIFAILALAYLIDKANKKRLNALFIVFSIMLFFYFAALTYGLPVSPQEQNLLFWLPTWR